MGFGLFQNPKEVRKNKDRMEDGLLDKLTGSLNSKPICPKKSWLVSGVRRCRPARRASATARLPETACGTETPACRTMSFWSCLRTAVARHDPISLIDPSATVGQIKQVHALLLTSARLDEPHLLGKLVAAVAATGNRYNPLRLTYAENLLSYSPCKPNVFSLNCMIRAFCKSPDPLHAFQFYNRILQFGYFPDNYTFTFLVRACTEVPSSKAGCTIHGAAIRRGFGCDAHVQSGLVHMYAELGMSDCFRGVYSEMKDPDLVCQTAMVGACAECGEVEFARELFDKMPSRDLVAWNTMIAGYEHLGRSREALDMFHLMQSERIKVDEATVVPVLSACGRLGALDQGRWTHVFIEKNRLRINVILGTALVEMYFKCGDTMRAMEVFWKMDEKNAYTWTTVIRGLSTHGSVLKCLECFELMKRDGIPPNAVTFVAVLHGCCVTGLVDKGQEYFYSMTSDHGIEPGPEHYGCMVDLYGRAGRLNDAVNIIHSMPMEPHAEAWGALLHSCRIYGNRELGEYASQKLMELNSQHDGAHVLISNIYAESRNWDGVGKIRSIMEAKGVKKEPGCTIIEVNGEVHDFFAGYKSHPRCQEIKEMLAEMSRRLQLAGYVARTDQVLFDIEEEEKTEYLGWHSERLAIAFGLVSLGEGVTIRITKNLRICLDCHDATKLISKAFDREIIVRDRKRFHHFKGGICSCKDYW